MHLGTVLLKDQEFAIDFMYEMKKLLLTVATLIVHYKSKRGIGPAAFVELTVVTDRPIDRPR